MKMGCTVLAVVLSASGIFGMDGMEWLGNGTWFDVVSASPTNLTLKFKGRFGIHQNDVWRRTAEYIENDEMFILTPDQRTRFVSRHASITLDPVSFRGQHKGFRITDRHNPPISHWHLARTNFFYVALSDTPVQVGEDDVEMIMENGEWKTYEKPQSAPKEEGGAQVYLPSPEPVQSIAAETPPEPPAVPTPEPVEAQVPVLEDGAPDIADGEDGQSEEKSKTNNLWLYALIPLVLSAAALYFIRRRHKI